MVQLWRRQSPEGRKSKAGLRHPTTGKLCNPAVNGTFFQSGKDESGKDEAAKGEEWAPPSIRCAQDTVLL